MDSIIEIIVHVLKLNYYFSKKNRCIHFVGSLVGVALILFILSIILFFVCDLGLGLALSIPRVFVSIFLIVLSVRIMNWGSKNVGYSEIALKYLYVRNENKSNSYCEFIRILIAYFTLVIGLVGFKPIINAMYIKIEADANEVLLFDSVLALSIAYLFLTESVISKVRRYRIKYITSCIVFFLLIILYYVYLNMVPVIGDGDLIALFIFAVGLLSVLDMIVNNVREMYGLLFEEKKDELEDYLSKIIKDYDDLQKTITSDISELKKDCVLIKEIWKRISVRSRVIVGLFVSVLVGIVIVLFNVL